MLLTLHTAAVLLLPQPTNPCCCHNPATTLLLPAHQDSLLAAFRAWAAQHGKPYAHDDNSAEFRARYEVWAANVVHIRAANARRTAAAAANAAPGSSSSSHARLGLTAHSDLTREEFRGRYLGAPMAARPFTPSPPSPTASRPAIGASRRHGPQPALLTGLAKPAAHWRYENVTPPASADWRTAQPPVLGPIKDQHVNGTPCGSCWAFSSVSIMEIASARATGARPPRRRVRAPACVCVCLRGRRHACVSCLAGRQSEPAGRACGACACAVQAKS